MLAYSKEHGLINYQWQFTIWIFRCCKGEENSSKDIMAKIMATGFIKGNEI
jgi:hypothetical protein